MTTQTTTEITTVQKAFEVFELEQCRVPEADYKAACETHPLFTDALKGGIEGFLRTRLAGSFGRHTQAVWLKDVDLVVFVEDPDDEYLASASGALEAVRGAVGALEIVYYALARVRALKVFVTDHDFTFDIVPAIERPDGTVLLARNLPDEGHDDWTAANPQGQVDAASEKNRVCDGIYVPGNRIVRFWNQRFGKNSKPLRSYHAESILHAALTGPCDYDELVVGFFDRAYDALAPGARTIDPGNPTAYVDDLLSDEDRAAARDKVEEARENAHAAKDIEEPMESMDAWTKVFGTGFPAPSTDPERVAEALRAGTAVSVGSSIKPSGKGEPIIRPRSWRER